MHSLEEARDFKSNTCRSLQYGSMTRTSHTQKLDKFILTWEIFTQSSLAALEYLQIPRHSHTIVALVDYLFLSKAIGVGNLTGVRCSIRFPKSALPLWKHNGQIQSLFALCGELSNVNYAIKALDYCHTFGEGSFTRLRMS